MHSKGSYFMRHSIRNLLESTVLYDILILVVYIYEVSTVIHSVYVYNTMTGIECLYSFRTPFKSDRHTPEKWSRHQFFRSAGYREYT